MSNKLIYIVSFSVLCLQGFASFAQSEVEERTIITFKNAKLELPEASRNFEKIRLEPVHVPNKVQDYKTEDVELSLPKITSKIKILPTPPDALPKLYATYLKVGFGNYGTPYLEGFHNSKRSDKFNYGVHARHFSSQNGPVKSSFVDNLSGLSENQLGGNIKYFTKEMVFKAALNYDRYKYKYYGFDPERAVKQDTLNIRQIYNFVTLHGGFEKLKKTEPFHYEVNAYLYEFADRFKTNELEIMGDAKFSYKLSEDKSLSSQTIISQSKKKDTSSIGRLFFITKPAFYFTKDKLQFRLGFNFAYTNDTLKKFDKAHLYPSANLDINVYEKKLIALMGIDGEMQKNTLRTFVRENPYLGQNQALYHTNKAMELYAGIKGNLVGVFNYKIRGAYTIYKNLYFYNNSILDTSRFDIFYAQSNSTVKSFAADFSYEVSNQLRLGLNSNFYSYEVGDSLSAWHRPKMVTTLFGTYNLNEKLYLNADIFYISGLTARNFISSPKKDTKLPAIIDLNLKANYKFTPVFTGFLELNNLLNRKYQRYQYYYVKGINIIAGATYSF